MKNDKRIITLFSAAIPIAIAWIIYTIMLLSARPAVPDELAVEPPQQEVSQQALFMLRVNGTEAEIVDFANHLMMMYGGFAYVYVMLPGDENVYELSAPPGSEEPDVEPEGKGDAKGSTI